MVHDGLWDVYDQVHMGSHGEKCAEKYNISRQDQDSYAELSYKRSQEAHENGVFNNEIIDVVNKKGEKIDENLLLVPSIEDGLKGVRFISTVVESGLGGSKWLKF